jgi:hypothetical protein
MCVVLCCVVCVLCCVVLCCVVCVLCCVVLCCVVCVVPDVGSDNGAFSIKVKQSLWSLKDEDATIYVKW